MGIHTTPTATLTQVRVGEHLSVRPEHFKGPLLGSGMAGQAIPPSAVKKVNALIVNLNQSNPNLACM